MAFKTEDKPLLEFGCIGWLTLEMLRWSPDSDLTGRRYIELLHGYRSSLEKVFSSYQLPSDVVAGAFHYIHTSLIDVSKAACNEKHTSPEAYDADKKRINDIIDEAERYMFKPH